MGWSGKFAWYAIRSAPRREMDVAAYFRDQGMRAFVPVELVTIRAGRGPKRLKLKEIERPFFPSYLFAQVHMDVATWHTIRSHDYVSAIVSGNVDNRPTPVPDAAMAHLIAAGPFREPGPKVGEMVKLSTGLFAGLITKITSVDKSDRIKVLIKFMGTDRPIDFNLSEVERMPDGYAAHQPA